MPSPSSHRSVERSHSPAADSDDSDLDLDIQELDPISTTPARGSRTEPSGSSHKPARIPLRNLRMGGLRRGGKRNRVYGELDSGADDDDADSTHQLLANHEVHQSEDGASLLGGRSRSNHDRSLSFSSVLRVPGLMSGSKKTADDDDELPQQDDTSSSRIVPVGSAQPVRYPTNMVSNAKYTSWSFLPVTLYNEFSFFFNMYFLLVALSQIIPALRIGYLSTYIAPLAFVLCITMGKEAWDDVDRRRRDREANSEEYTVLKFSSPLPEPANPRRRKHLKSDSVKLASKKDRTERDSLSDIQEDAENETKQPSSTIVEASCKSSDLKVGDVLRLSKGRRVPADVVILQCSNSETLEVDDSPDAQLGDLVALDEEADSSLKGKEPETEHQEKASSVTVGETFIRTDQLDGETDWKLRLASPLTQNLAPEELVRLRVNGGKPDKKVNEFLGTVELLPSRQEAMQQHAVLDSEDGTHTTAALSIDNTAWANTIIASQGTTIAVILYTGPHTRSALSTTSSRSKTGLLENEINSLTKILCALTLALSIVLVALQGFESKPGKPWYIQIMRFLVLFSTIVPISLRVNLDMGKTAYSRFIQRDAGIAGAVVRTSTIPEDLGRIEYLLSDKTGTLTQNEMEMKKIHIGTVSYASDAMDEVTSYVRQRFYVQPTTEPATQSMLITPSSTYINAAAVGATRTRREISTRVRDIVLALALCHNVTPTVDEEDGQQVTSYQASSPDEIAIVKWAESVGLKLASRDRKSITLTATTTDKPVVRANILDIFPFTSEGKRMGIIVHFQEDANKTNGNLEDGDIWFYQKGADTVMSSIVVDNDWLDEETANMAREGLRTLVVGAKRLTYQRYQEFAAKYHEASLAIQNRDVGMQNVVAQYLECELELLGVTGVEDRLQRDIKPSLELFRNAGIKIWMLTGDKVETARCVAVSAKLVARSQYIYTVEKLRRKDNAREHLDFLRNKTDACLLIDGESLALFLTYLRIEFISVAVRLPTVVACRCSPTQKAEIATLIREYTKKRVCCIGDGGNDVSMIQAADVGVGIVGKEGRQASLAADFSIEQFCHLVKLLVWHGRNSYKRSAKLAQFVIHRGLIVAVCQTMFSIALEFEPEGLYVDWLMVGYATVYTAAPVLSLVLDTDVDENLANLYPELYRELTPGRSLSYRTFFVWVLVSIYQGSVIQGLSQILTGVEGKEMTSVSYTVLILNELLMVAIEITTWHPVMIVCLLGTFLMYVGSIPFLGGYFNLEFIITLGFVWRVAAILAISLVPPYAAKLIRRRMKPPSYRKVQT